MGKKQNLLLFVCCAAGIGLILCIKSARFKLAENVRPNFGSAKQNRVLRSGAASNVIQELKLPVNTVPVDSGSDAPLISALLGDSHAPVSQQARRLLRQAFLGLNHVHGVAGKYATSESPTSSWLNQMRAFGRMLFYSDYNYAARICPELDPDQVEFVYSNALAVLGDTNLVPLAEGLEREACNSSGLQRPPAPMNDHYEPAFHCGAPVADLTSASNVLAVVSRFVDQDPLTTDLFNDAFLYVMSKTEFEESREEEIRVAAKIADWEAKGVQPSLEELHNDDPQQNIAETGLDPTTELFYQKVFNFFRDIFSYRLAHYHGITNEQCMDELSKLRVTPALWLHIGPPSK